MPRFSAIHRVPFRFVSALAFLLVIGTTSTEPANGQFGSFGKKTLDSSLCAFGGIGLTKASQKIAEVESKRLKLPPAAAAAQQRQLQIGMAMAICNGGKSILNTTFAKMSEKDKKQRQDNIDAAVADSAPTTKTAPLPDHPSSRRPSPPTPSSPTVTGSAAWSRITSPTRVRVTPPSSNTAVNRRTASLKWQLSREDLA